MNKRAIAILGAIFILIVGALGFLIYSRSGNKETDTKVEEVVTENPQPTIEPTPIETPTIIPEEPIPEPEVGKLTRLSDTPIISPVLTFQGDGITYMERTGQLFRTELQVTDQTVLLSNKQEISIALKNNINRVLWPIVGKSFIAESDGLGRKIWSYYNPDKGAYIDIPNQVYSLDWMPSGEKIVFVWVDENKKAFLNISNPDTTGYDVLTDLYEPDNLISVAPDGKNILFYRNQNMDLTKNTINMVSIDGQTFKTMIAEGYNKGVKWSPDSSKFLFTKRDSSGKFMLWLANVSSGEIRNLNIATTVEKSIWSKDSQYIYVGVPVKGTAGEGLTEDTISQITAATAARVEYPANIPIDVQELFLNSDGNILFFKNGQDQMLYYLNVNKQVSTNSGNSGNSRN